MFNLKVSTLIASPIQRVFDYMSTPENDLQWQYGTLATATITNPHDQLGIYFRSLRHLMGRRHLGTYAVLESQANLKYQFKSISGPLHVQTTYTFEPVGTKTRVYITTRVGVLNFFHINEQVLGNRMKRQLRENLAVLKRLLETNTSPSVSTEGTPSAHLP